MVKWIITVVFCQFLLIGCAKPVPIEIIRTVEVKVPVPVQVDVPEVLALPFQPIEIPQFVPPGDPLASSALTHDGEQHIKQLILDLYQRVRGWEAWSTELRPP